ncbi:type VI secretion system accessory protein TagJ [Paracraurococcus lichenis]|uniref:Type VI secretion system accessory protein TagJ n=1 Tax=Paracraurococcus lichenis TaxID=3064888 RepID=A0ABT9E9S2_9PROT|nr:type VI secretion system accessory protein TagJ [Paracraurococcus sp. LOR1-02]MDO9712944.1 type VI secretion system accessory protein TagJ [Paracraurococcus sp. LOR1-02]
MTASPTAEAGAHFQAGHLAAAIEAATRAVRGAPAAAAPRLLLAELLAFAGETERADRILDAASGLAPEAAVGIAQLRQLLRADLARREVFREGRLPDFPDGPNETQRHALAALLALREGEPAEAARLAAAAEAARPRLPGRHDGRAFDDLRDADDLLAGTVEVLTTAGTYLWIPAERVARLAPRPPRRPRDLLWRQAELTLRDGPSADVFLPVLYPMPGDAAEPLRLGRATEWQGPPGGPMRGLGQRVLLVGEEAVTAMELGTLEFEAAA